MARAGDRSSASVSNVNETPADSSAGRVLSRQHEIKQWQEDAYRTFHQHPELAHQELRTAAAAADALREAGYEVHENVGTTGVVGIYGMATDRPCSCAPTWTRCR